MVDSGIRSVCHICQPTVSEISQEINDLIFWCSSQYALWLHCWKKSRLCPGNGTPESIRLSHWLTEAETVKFSVPGSVFSIYPPVTGTVNNIRDARRMLGSHG